MTGIAKKFHMSIYELKSLNSLKKNYVRPKQNLLVYNGLANFKFPETISRANSSPAVTNAESEKGTPPPSAASPIVYSVKQGECLALIAQKHGCTIENLMTWNNLKSQNLLVGQKLKILSSFGETASSPETKAKMVSRPAGTNAKSTSKPKAKYVWYTIKPGDNLWEIAEQYDATISEIKKLNNITNTHRIRAGQKIKIEPGK